MTDPNTNEWGMHDSTDVMTFNDWIFRHVHAGHRVHHTLGNVRRASPDRNGTDTPFVDYVCDSCDDFFTVYGDAKPFDHLADPAPMGRIYRT